MKAKRFLSLLVALTMLVSVFGGITLFAENVAAPVTASVGDSDLAGATDVAVSFKSTITLPQGVATGTDLSGIVFTDGETDLAPATITEGEVTSGLFNEIVLETPVLAQGTEYTLVIPALGDNAETNISFTTVDGPYFVKEDLTDRYNGSWSRDLDNDYVHQDWYFKDADGDGVNDMMEGVGGDYSFTFLLPSNVPLTDVNELMIETRVRYRANNTAALDDGSLPDDNDPNNGGLLLVRGNETDNNSFEVRTNADGYLTYGGMFGRGLVTDYKVYDNTWYTIRLAFNADESRASLYITDDEGNEYQGESAISRYGLSVSPLSEIKYSYGYWTYSDVDYLYVWAKEPEVTATVGTSDLAYSSDVALSFKSVITLPKAIATGTDLSGIVITDGETNIYPMNISEAGVSSGVFKTIEIETPVLEQGTEYTLVVPALGSNPTKNFHFTTAEDPYIVKEDFNGGYNSTWLTKLGGSTLAPEYFLADINGDKVMDAMSGIGGDAQNTLWLPTKVSLTDVNELTIKTRVRYRANNVAALGDGSLQDDNDDSNGGLLTIRGNGADNNSFEVRTNADGYLTYGGMFGRGIETDYKVYNNTWYTISLTFSEDEGSASLFITDDEGNSYEGEVANARYGAYQPIDPISEVRYSYGHWTYSDIDYLYVCTKEPEVIEENPYIVKEDFTGGYSNTWVTKLGGSTIASDSYLADTDGDGVTDVMTGIGGDAQNTLWLSEHVPLTDVNELIIETRVKYSANSKSPLKDGSLPDDNDDSNGGLLLVRGNGADNNSFEVRTDANGYLTYGGMFGRGIDTDYKIYNDKWYTIRLDFSSNEGSASLFITDDEGNGYQGPIANSRYGSDWAINPLSEVRYSYGLWYKSDIDYLYVLKNDGLGKVSATYEDTDLNGATDMNLSNKEATLTFKNPITEADLAKITSNANVKFELADSGRVANAKISGITECNKTYYINVPMIAGNKSTVISFKTGNDSSTIANPEFSSSKVVAGKELTASAEYADANIKDAMLILAFYNRENQVTRILPASFISQADGNTKKATASMTPTSDEVIAKAFVWNSLSGMKPFAQSETIISSAILDTKIYLSEENGSDTTGNGTSKAPYLSIDKALEKLSTFNSNPDYIDTDIDIIFDGDSYSVRSNIEIEESMVSNLNSVTFKPSDGVATLRGSFSAKGSEFTLVTDSSTLAMLNPAVNGKVYKINLSDYDVNVNFEQYSKPEKSPMNTAFYYGGETQTIARYPNDSNLVANTTEATDVHVLNEHLMNELTITDNDLDATHKNAWSGLDLSETWADGWFFYDWEQLRGRVFSVTSSGITVKAESGRADGFSKNNGKYFIYNLPYEIDEEGEYAILNNVLYFYPYEADVANGTFKNTYIQLCTDEWDMFTVNADNVTFEKLAFENQSGHFINANGNNINILGCEFSKGSKNSVKLTGNNCSVKSCDFHDIGALALDVRGGNRDNLTSSNTVVENCYFARTGQFQRTSTSAVYLGGCGVTVRKNTITGTPHHAIGYSGNNHVIEYNNISNCLTDGSTDAGIIYAGADLSNIGTIIQHNYFHDSYGSMGAIYWDDRLSGQRANNNVFENISQTLFIHAGICNSFNGNIVIKGSNSAQRAVSYRGRSSYVVDDNNASTGYIVWDTQPFIDKKYSHNYNTFMAWLVGSDVSYLNIKGVPWEGSVWQNAYGVGSATDSDKNPDENYKHVLNYVNYKTSNKIEETVMKDNHFVGFSYSVLNGIINCNLSSWDSDYISATSDIVSTGNTSASSLAGEYLTKYNDVVNNSGIYVDAYRTTLN